MLVLCPLTTMERFTFKDFSGAVPERAFLDDDGIEFNVSIVPPRRNVGVMLPSEHS